MEHGGELVRTPDGGVAAKAVGGVLLNRASLQRTQAIDASARLPYPFRLAARPAK